jgi:hypothetical protein
VEVLWKRKARFWHSSVLALRATGGGGKSMGFNVIVSMITPVFHPDHLFR